MSSRSTNFGRKAGNVLIVIFLLYLVIVMYISVKLHQELCKNTCFVSGEIVQVYRKKRGFTYFDYTYVINNNKYTLSGARYKVAGLSAGDTYVVAYNCLDPENSFFLLDHPLPDTIDQGTLLPASDIGAYDIPFMDYMPKIGTKRLIETLSSIF